MGITIKSLARELGIVSRALMWQIPRRKRLYNLLIL
jgi:hypothetical protein